jgi:hypothetical protein
LGKCWLSQQFRTPLHIHELKGAQLHHREILRRHFIGTAKKRRSDITAKNPCVRPRSKAQKISVSGGFAVRAGDADDFAGQTSKNASISLVITAPLSLAAASSGVSAGYRAAEDIRLVHILKITGPSASRARLFQFRRA